MGYRTQAQLARDSVLMDRITACAATQSVMNPSGWVWERNWLFSAQPGWDTAYASAIASGIIAPGGDEAVITDAQILSAVQAVITADPESISRIPPNSTV